MVMFRFLPVYHVGAGALSVTNLLRTSKTSPAPGAEREEVIKVYKRKIPYWYNKEEAKKLRGFFKKKGITLAETNHEGGRFRLIATAPDEATWNLALWEAQKDGLAHGAPAANFDPHLSSIY